MALSSLNSRKEEGADDNDDDWYSDHDLISQYFIFLTILTSRHDGHMLQFLKHMRNMVQKVSETSISANTRGWVLGAWWGADHPQNDNMT